MKLIDILDVFEAQGDDILISQGSQKYIFKHENISNKLEMLLYRIEGKHDLSNEYIEKLIKYNTHYLDNEIVKHIKITNLFSHLYIELEEE